VRVTSEDQNGDYQNARQVGVPGSDRFWTVDASLGYRLPQQHGVIALEARNALNNHFRFQDSDPAETTILWRRTVTLHLSLAF
jgi:hypothetical protein